VGDVVAGSCKCCCGVVPDMFKSTTSNKKGFELSLGDVGKTIEVDTVAKIGDVFALC